MLTLDEAIAHCKEKAEELRTEASWYTHPECKRVKAKIDDCLECAEEHEQLAEWLTELKELRERKQIVVIDPEIIRKAADALVEAIGQIDWNKIIECNLCHGQAPVCVTSAEQYQSKFCPKCGAQMEEGDF